MKPQSENGITGYSHPKCYANRYNDCSEKISIEHFISRSLLQQISVDKSVNVAGFSWQEPGEGAAVPISTLGSNILCEKHNSTLHTLDDEIGLLGKILTEFNDDFKKSYPKTTDVRKINGPKIERWLLKCLIGIYHSNNRSDRLKPETLDLLFGKMAWPLGWGMYFCEVIGMKYYYSDNILFKTGEASQTQQAYAGFLRLKGFPFLLALAQPLSSVKLGIWRPSSIRLDHGRIFKEIKFDWEKMPCGMGAAFERLGPYKGPPPYFKEYKMKPLKNSRRVKKKQ